VGPRGDLWEPSRRRSRLLRLLWSTIAVKTAPTVGAASGPVGCSCAVSNHRAAGFFALRSAEHVAAKVPPTGPGGAAGFCGRGLGRDRGAAFV